MNTNAQFGLATLWRRAKHKLTPQVVKDILASDRFQNRLEPWTIIQSLGSNTKARFEQTKMLRSNEGVLAVSPYAIRFVDWQTISRSRIVHFPSKPLTRPYVGGGENRLHLRAPWSLSPNLQKTLRQFLRNWHLQVLAYQVPCHTPSFKTVFVKHASVLDQKCSMLQQTMDPIQESSDQPH